MISYFSLSLSFSENENPHYYHLLMQQQQQPTFVISVEIIEKDIYRDLLEISVIRNPSQAKNLMAVELVVANLIIIIQILLIQNLVSLMQHLLSDRHFGH